MALDLKCFDNAEVIGPGPDVFNDIRMLVEVFDLQGMIERRLPGATFDPKYPPVAILQKSLPGQHDVCVIFIDATIFCGPGDEKAVAIPGNKHVQLWSGSAAFSSQLIRMLIGSRAHLFPRLVALRVANAVKRMKPIAPYTCDQVTMDIEDDPLWLRNDIDPNLCDAITKTIEKHPGFTIVDVWRPKGQLTVIAWRVQKGGIYCDACCDDRDLRMNRTKIDVAQPRTDAAVFDINMKAKNDGIWKDMPQLPATWFMSTVGDPTNWDYQPKPEDDDVQPTCVVG